MTDTCSRCGVFQPYFLSFDTYKDTKIHVDMTILRTDPQSTSTMMDCSRSHILLHHYVLPGRTLLVAE